MATTLNKPLTRELTKFPGVIITLTADGITVKVKRRQKKVDIPWEKVFGSAAMVKDNEEILYRGCKIILSELGYVGDGDSE